MSQHNLFCFVIYSSGLSCVVTFLKTCIVCIYKHKGCGTSKDEMSFSTIIDTVLVTYKTTGNILSVGLDSSSMLVFAMDLYASSLIQLSVRLSYWPSPCSSDCCQSTHNTLALHSNGLATSLFANSVTSYKRRVWEKYPKLKKWGQSDQYPRN